MATINPKLISDPSLAPVVTRRAADSVTWKKGQIGYFTSGTVTPVATLTGGDTAPYVMFAEDQAASTSSTDVKVHLLQPGCRMEIQVTNNGTDAAVGAANLGLKYSLREDSNICSLDVNDTTNADWEVERLAAEYEPARNTTAGSPGKCVIILR